MAPMAAGIAAAIPAGATEEHVRAAFRKAGGHRIGDLAQVGAALDVETVVSRHRTEERDGVPEPIGAVVRRSEREARRRERG